eukprot:GHVU01192490.1.p2 GENE.GHVU01192490.1~~GHVU01192490.1.p2  ORF type:complete len:172 (-),score=37.31 GHVU01192490.1:497-1012(-)
MGETMDKITLYMQSITRYGKSPFIYPVYGLGGLPEGFSRLSAIHGGVYMLNKPVVGFEFDQDGKVCGVKSENDEVVKCKMVVCDPTYVLEKLPGKVKQEGQIVRCICIISAPLKETDGKSSCQIIIPQKQLKRHHDVYIAIVSHTHGVAKNGKYIAMVSTTVETDNPLAAP